MIVLFSSMVKTEGTVQFLLSFADALLANGEDVRIFSEHGVCDDGPGHITFDHIKTIEVAFFVSQRIRNCANAILELNPSMVLFTDSALGGRVMRRLLSNKVHCVLVKHDPEPHPTNKSISFKEIICNLLTARWAANQDQYIYNYLLLSRASKDRFSELNPWLSKKCSVMPLCPHPPKCSKGVIPSELVGKAEHGNPFYLFFGRIDKYKGIEGLLEAYSNYSGSTSLVIAGSGDFTKRELELLEAVKNVCIIHRYVTDEDLVWLFSNCRAVILPYIEASQSGVLAMAYHFGKPVVVTNLPGLTEFVVEGKTGLVCNNIADITRGMQFMDSHAVCMRADVVKYAKENLDWNIQVGRWLKQIEASNIGEAERNEPSV